MATVRHSGAGCGACEVRGDLTWTSPSLCESNFNATASGVSWCAARNGSTAPSVRSSLRPFQGAVSFSGRILRSVTRFYRCRRDRSWANALARGRYPPFPRLCGRGAPLVRTSPDGPLPPKHEEVAAPSPLMSGLELSLAASRWQACPHRLRRP